ncbi:MAG: hypothetical protein OHK0021_17600 [Bryobacter sp.]
MGMQAKAALSAEEFLALPVEDDRNLELDGGKIVEFEIPGLAHGMSAGRIGRRLAEHVEDGGMGLVLVHQVAFRLNEWTVRAPDVAVLLGSQFEINDAAYPGAPQAEAVSRRAGERDLD